MKELSKLRQKYGYTQLEMANMLGLHKSTYNQKRMAKDILNQMKWLKYTISFATLIVS